MFLSYLILYILPIILEEHEWTKDFKFLFIIFLGMYGFLIALFFISFRRVKKDELKTKEFKLNNKYIKIIFIIIMLYYLTKLLSLGINSLSGLIEFIFRDRVGEYLNNPIVDNSVIIQPIIDILSYILITYFWKNKKFKYGNLIWGIIFFDKLLLSHTRFVIIIDALLPILYYNYFVKKIKIRYMCIVMVLVLVFISVGNYARGGAIQKQGIKEAIKFENVIEQLGRASSGSTESFYKLYEKDIEFDYLKQYYLYLPVSLIPRALWSEKPVVSYFWRVTKEITGYYPSGKSNPVLTTTIFGEAYHQLGYIGVMLISYIYILIIKITINLINKFQYTELIILKIIIHIPMDMRGGINSIILAQVSNVYPLIILMLIGIYYRKRYSEMNLFKDIL